MPPLHQDNGDYKYDCDKEKKLHSRGGNFGNSSADEEVDNNIHRYDSFGKNGWNKNDDQNSITTPTPGWRMVKQLVSYFSFPSALVAWVVTKRVSVVLASTMVIPAISIVQGGYAILRYRCFYGNTPFPNAPAHGVVKVATKRSSSSSEASASTDNSSDSEPIHVDTATGKINGEVNNKDSDRNSEKKPLRLLVLGDSLAIGVGQSMSATPIMPEVIAKSLSKAMGGRPVLWTCHGAPGASAGWIVRELERSINPFQRTSSGDTECDEVDCSEECALSLTAGETEDSSSDDSSLDIESGENCTNANDYETWHERLKQQRIQFDPHVVAPFDIAVVLTGSNDLKSAFFPFLLTGDDLEFHRQAQLRGGGYGKELRRVLEVVSRRMRLRFQTFRDSVEEKVRESVDNVMDRIGIDHPHHQDHLVGRQSSEKLVSAKMLRGNGSDHTEDSLGADVDGKSMVFPLVVLPGMPARALPLFENAPLRWIAVPIVDAMDAHKRHLARTHQHEVMFVEAPSVKDISDYQARTGLYWRERCTDDTRLTLRDIKHRHARRIETDMKQFFSRQKEEETISPSSQTLLPLRRKRHHRLFSVDGIHPNDLGYEFWGRYIGNAIVQEWKYRSSNQGVI